MSASRDPNGNSGVGNVEVTCKLKLKDSPVPPLGLIVENVNFQLPGVLRSNEKGPQIRFTQCISVVDGGSTKADAEATCPIFGGVT